MATGRLNKEQVIGGLKALGMTYKEDASYSELLALLKSAQAPAKVEAKLESEVVEERLQPPVAPELKTEEGDYLRKYQYRKQTQPGSKDSDPPIGSKAEKMKLFLLSQPKVRIFIPRATGEDKSIPQPVTLNGYRLDFEKQTYIDLPLAVAEVLGESLKQTEAATAQMRIDYSKQKESALG